MAERTKSKSARKSASTSTPTEEVAVTDTATTEAAPAAEEAAGTPAANGEATAPEAAKPKEDHELNLYTAIMTFASDHNVESLQESYRAVPVAARGRAQGAAMKRAMSEGGVDVTLLGDVLDAFNSLPAATKTTRTKVELEPVDEGAVRLTGIFIAFQNLRNELGEDAFNRAEAWYNGGDLQVPGNFQKYVDAVSANLSKNSTVKTGGPRGPRKTFKESFKELVDRGAIPVGSTLKGAGDEVATVTAEGKIQTADGSLHDAPSTAAKVHTTKDGKAASLNGWQFWTLDGKAIGDLRQS